MRSYSVSKELCFLKKKHNIIAIMIHRWPTITFLESWPPKGDGLSTASLKEI